MSKTKSWFFEKINKINKPLARHVHNHKSKQKSEKTRAPAF